MTEVRPAPRLPEGDVGAHLAAVRHPSLILAAVAFAALVASLTQTLVVPVLPQLPALLGSSPGATSWVVTVTVVTAAAANPLLGRLGDQFGLRRVLLWTLVVFVLGSALCAASPNLALLIVGRALQGGATASIPLGISLLSALMPSERRAVGVALVSTLLGIGGAVGVALSGVVAEAWGVRGLFVVTAVAGTVALVAAARLLPEPPRGDGGTPVDVVGGFLLVATLTLVLLPVSRGSSWGRTAPPTLGLFAAALFGAVQLRRAAPVVDLRLAAERPMLLTNLASLLIGFTLFVNFLGTTAVLQAPLEGGHGFGLGAADAGLALLPTGFVMALFSVAAARIVVRSGGRATLLVGIALMIVGLAPRLVLHAEVWHVIVSAAVVSGGTAIAFAAAPALVLDSTPPRRTAAATGLNALARSMGLAVASAVFGTLGDFGGPGLAVFVSSGVAASVAALGAALAIPAAHRPDHRSHREGR